MTEFLISSRAFTQVGERAFERDYKRFPYRICHYCGLLKTTAINNDAWHCHSCFETFDSSTQVSLKGVRRWTYIYLTMLFLDLRRAGKLSHVEVNVFSHSINEFIEKI